MHVLVTILFQMYSKHMTGKELMGRNIRQIRRQQGYTQEQLAEATCLSDVHLRRLERGECNPHISTIISIALCLHVSIDDLVGMNEQELSMWQANKRPKRVVCKTGAGEMPCVKQ